MEHSSTVGGSTAKRILNCPGSVALCAKMPPQGSSSYADEGTLLHNAMDRILSSDINPRDVIGMRYQGEVITEELYQEKIVVALDALDEIDPNQEMEFATETRVSFGDLIPGAFGTTDFVGRKGDCATVLDWKFGNGVPVPAEESEQGMFYAAAGMRTPSLKWAFDGVKQIEIIIVQPPHVRRWVTTPERIRAFEQDLICAVATSQKPNAPLFAGDHCRWCAAKPTCPKMTGAVDRALKTQIEDLDADKINSYLKNADVLEGWIKELRAVAFQMMEKGVVLPDWKIVQKESNRSWTDEAATISVLQGMGLSESVLYTKKIVSPAQAEKLLKPLKKVLPEAMTKRVVTGTTMVRADDARSAVLQIGQHLAGLSKLV